LFNASSVINGELRYGITGNFCGYLIFAVFCGQLRAAEIKVIKYFEIILFNMFYKKMAHNIHASQHPQKLPVIPYLSSPLITELALNNNQSLRNELSIRNKRLLRDIQEKYFNYVHFGNSLSNMNNIPSSVENLSIVEIINLYDNRMITAKRFPKESFSRLKKLMNFSIMKSSLAIIQ
jgi:hypothetical protein